MYIVLCTQEAEAKATYNTKVDRLRADGSGGDCGPPRRIKVEEPYILYSLGRIAFFAGFGGAWHCAQKERVQGDPTSYSNFLPGNAIGSVL